MAVKFHAPFSYRSLLNSQSMADYSSPNGPTIVLFSLTTQLPLLPPLPCYNGTSPCYM